VTQTWIEPPPRRQGGLGCFGKGCLILFFFLVFLCVAFAFGSIYAVRHLKTTFFNTEGVALPPNRATQEDQQLALANWRIFERSARAHQQAKIEMTADELNALIASQPGLRDKAYVTIEGNSARLQVSFALTDVRWMRGYYANGECTVRSASTGDPAALRLTDITLNNRSVDDAVLTWLYPLRRFMEKWTDENDLKTFEIRDGKVFLETKGSG
jgi:hypothetical protein